MHQNDYLGTGNRQAIDNWQATVVKYNKTTLFINAIRKAM